MSLTSAILERFAAERVSRLPWSQKILSRAVPGLSNGVYFSATHKRIWGLYRPQSWILTRFSHNSAIVIPCVCFVWVLSMWTSVSAISVSGALDGFPFPWQTRSQTETVTRFHFRPIFPLPPIERPLLGRSNFVDCRDKLECHYSSTIAISTNFPSMTFIWSTIVTL